jgi:hypothetical protein
VVDSVVSDTILPEPQESLPVIEIGKDQEVHPTSPVTEHSSAPQPVETPVIDHELESKPSDDLPEHLSPSPTVDSGAHEFIPTTLDGEPALDSGGKLSEHPDRTDLSSERDRSPPIVSPPSVFLLDSTASVLTGTESSVEYEDVATRVTLSRPSPRRKKTGGHSHRPRKSRRVKEDISIQCNDFWDGESDLWEILGRGNPYVDGREPDHPPRPPRKTVVPQSTPDEPKPSPEEPKSTPDEPEPSPHESIVTIPAITHPTTSSLSPRVAAGKRPSSARASVSEGKRRRKATEEQEADKAGEGVISEEETGLESPRPISDETEPWSEEPLSDVVPEKDETPDGEVESSVPSGDVPAGVVSEEVKAPGDETSPQEGGDNQISPTDHETIVPIVRAPTEGDSVGEVSVEMNGQGSQTSGETVTVTAATGQSPRTPIDLVSFVRASSGFWGFTFGMWESG